MACYDRHPGGPPVAHVGGIMAPLKLSDPWWPRKVHKETRQLVGRHKQGPEVA